MLLEIAVGDAYGAGFEYVSTSIIRQRNDLSGYIQHPRHGTKPGRYTDDTQMSLAITEAIVEDDPWTRESLAERFVRVFKRDPREGYASGFHAFLCSVNSGAEFLERIHPDSDKSGAAMRAGPIGVFANVDDVKHRCTVQAALTHNSPSGIAAATAAALMTHYFIFDSGKPQELRDFIASHVPDDAWANPWRGKVGSQGVMSVSAAITAIAEHRRMSDVLKACIDFSGDVDTVAAIALGAASWSREIEQDLPDLLIHNLENDAFGRDYIGRLDERLTAIVAKNLAGG